MASRNPTSKKEKRNRMIEELETTNLHAQAEREAEVAEPLPSVPSAHVKSLMDSLDNAIQAGQLCDLHTHLLGMGSSEFWIEEIIKKLIPKLVMQKRIEFYEDYASLNHDTIFQSSASTPFRGGDTPDLSPNSRLFARCTPELQKLCQSASGSLHWTFDVVYSVKTWKRVLGVNTEIGVQNQLRLPKKGDLRQQWIVFNARTQLFEYREGITNEQLLDHLEQSPHFLSVLKNCFSLLNAHGDPPSNIEGRAFHDKFTPEFYPKRYELKDDIYSQYLDTLDVLLSHVLLKVYAPSGVSYVEFSVGYGDLITRPWVFYHLSNPTIEVGHNVVVRFLAAFGRHESPELDPSLDPLSPVLYGPYLDKLAVLQTAVERYALQRVLVGLDYVGDEKGHPYCPFGLDQFTEFVMYCRLKFNGKFGLRYHCGEFTFDVGSLNHFNHMFVSSKIILAIMNGIQGPTPLRVGHGVAFLAYKDVFSFPSDVLSDSLSLVIRCLQEMKRRGVPIEVNLRSNAVLLPLMDNATSVDVFLNTLHLPIILCTDDDGIWCVSEKYSGKTFHSVAAEFASAFKQGAIPDLSRTKLIIETTSRSKFDFAVGKRRPLDQSARMQVQDKHELVGTSGPPPVGEDNAPAPNTPRVCLTFDLDTDSWLIECGVLINKLEFLWVSEIGGKEKQRALTHLKGLKKLLINPSLDYIDFTHDVYTQVKELSFNAFSILMISIAIFKLSIHSATVARSYLDEVPSKFIPDRDLLFEDLERRKLHTIREVADYFQELQ
eukprot:TRINITY_DN247_c0_g1_i3.p1 TRINITY_DN247_c0_g1~~TRINITY_DN247_c0_g1_i3.p1  ORF type:complete len:770 (-),score=103.02 TRINITY_DN247_c0_g1_i3:141-2450(-)